MENNLHELAKLARDIGQFPAFVQGGGGNVSLKLDDTIMSVKASGFRLSDLSTTSGLVEVNYPQIREFYQSTRTDLSLPELITLNEQATVSSLLEQVNALRPSMETGFHAVLGGVVLHTHSVYANLLTCSIEGKDLVSQLFPTALWVSYNTPGVALTFAILATLKDNPAANILFLENHGLIVIADTASEALELHSYVNKTIQNHFGLLPETAYFKILLEETSTGFKSASSDLSAVIKDNQSVVEKLHQLILFPDQVVYGKQVGFNHESDLLIIINTTDGSISYNTSRSEALAFEETFAAWLYIISTISQHGLTLKTIPQAEGVFIANLESEKYRKRMQ